VRGLVTPRAATGTLEHLPADIETSAELERPRYTRADPVALIARPARCQRLAHE
jgi:hypothetical protein